MVKKTKMAPTAPIETGIGNTKIPVKKRINAAICWAFTLNNWTQAEYDSLVTFLKKGSKFVIGKEIGEEGTPHLQGFAEFDTKCRPGEAGESLRIHWEHKVKKSTIEDNIVYCSKDGNYIVHRYKIPKALKVLDESKLYNWQKQIIEIIEKEPDDRHIYWIWEGKGKMGKTTFAKYLSYKYGAIPIEGKKNDILYCAAMFESDLYIMDLERTMEDYVSYGALEKIKNGYYMCSKYESKPIIRNPPHLIVFANFAPDLTALSLDRWKVIELK